MFKPCIEEIIGLVTHLICSSSAYNNWLKFVPACGLHQTALLAASCQQGDRLPKRHN